MGILERGGEIRTVVVDLKSYDGPEGQYAHKVINHAVAYVDSHQHA